VTLSPTALPRAVSAAEQDVVLPKTRSSLSREDRTHGEGFDARLSKGCQGSCGAPNVLLILTDDVGFGASSTFGGPIQTPNFQRLVDTGLRYNMFHTTALCSPTNEASPQTDEACCVAPVGGS
jgi:arylsulfatase